MNPESKLIIKYVWNDEHMIEISVIASNDRYYGTTKVYTTADDLLELSEKMTNFPTSQDEKVTYCAGEKNATSYFSMQFFVVDNIGHTSVIIELEDNVSTKHLKEEKNKLLIEIPTEPNLIDEFNLQLRSLAKTGYGEAILIGKYA